MSLYQYISEKLVLNKDYIDNFKKNREEDERLTAIRQENYENDNIKKWLDKHGLYYNYKIDDDYTVRVRANDATIYLSEEEEIPEFIQFSSSNNFKLVGKSVSGEANKLKNLRGLPKIINGNLTIVNFGNLKNLEGLSNVNVKGDLSIEKCSIENLEGISDSVEGTIILDRLEDLISLKGIGSSLQGSINIKDCNNLKSLKDGPQSIKGIYRVNKCDITSLEGIAQNPRSIYISKCDNLTSLKGSPKSIKKNFSCIDCNGLKDLSDGPEIVGGNYTCADCNGLTSLNGAPKEVKNFDCSNSENLNDIDSMSNSTIHGNFICIGCPVTSFKKKPNISEKIIKK